MQARREGGDASNPTASAFAKTCGLFNDDAARRDLVGEDRIAKHLHASMSGGT